MKNKNNKLKINVPMIIDDPLVGKIILPFSLFVFDDQIIIENGKLIYKPSRLSIVSEKIFNLNEIKKLVLIKSKTSHYTKDFKKAIEECRVESIGELAELILIDLNDNKYELIPKINLLRGKKRFANFIKKLVDLSGLILEEVNPLP